jgi:hypothetical protein
VRAFLPFRCIYVTIALPLERKCLSPRISVLVAEHHKLSSTLGSAENSSTNNDFSQHTDPGTTLDRTLLDFKQRSNLLPRSPSWPASDFSFFCILYSPQRMRKAPGREGLSSMYSSKAGHWSQWARKRISGTHWRANKEFYLTDCCCFNVCLSFSWFRFLRVLFTDSIMGRWVVSGPCL